MCVVVDLSVVEVQMVEGGERGALKDFILAKSPHAGVNGHTTRISNDGALRQILASGYRFPGCGGMSRIQAFALAHFPSTPRICKLSRASVLMKDIFAILQ